MFKGEEYILDYPRVYPKIKVVVSSVDGDMVTVKGMGGKIVIHKDKLK